MPIQSLLLRVPRNTEISPEMAQNFLASLLRVVKKASFFKRLVGGVHKQLALELIVRKQQIMYVVSCHDSLVDFVKTQIQSAYPLVLIESIDDPLTEAHLHTVKLQLAIPNYYPLHTYIDFKDVDPMSAVLSVLSKATPDEVMVVQIAIANAGNGWQSQGRSAIMRGIPKGTEGQKDPLPGEAGIKEKIAHPGYFFTLRLGTTQNEKVDQLSSAFGVFTRADGNHFSLKHEPFWSKSWSEKLLERSCEGKQILNIVELASLWHLPGEKIKVSSIAWGHSVLSEPPENLPIAEGLSDEQKSEINFFARTNFRNSEQVFGIKTSDRRRHVWAIGKTGTGKSTLIANMAIDDFKKDRGMAIIDPHGDLCDTIMDYVPSRRVNDVVYFNPADREYSVNLNPLEVENQEERELVVSGIVAIFNKLYGHSWGPRLEYILRNTLLSLAEIPGTTLVDVVRILTEVKYRQKVVEKLTDPVMKSYWRDEFEKMPDRLKQESISPILNKVGQFVSSPLIRSVIGQQRSSINLDDIMNNKKILIVNLSQGRLGEDNAALLGAMLITKLQLAAMRRVDIPEHQRSDFYLYVDEFQNFATTSFIKILSEARKYRLNLMMANQYMAQIPQEITKAILGNAGTMMCFTIGADDAATVKREYSEVFTENDLVGLSNYQVAVRLMVDAHATRPFLATTLPLPMSKNQNREKVIRVSRERYAKKKSVADSAVLTGSNIVGSTGQAPVVAAPVQSSPAEPAVRAEQPKMGYYEPRKND